MRKIKIIGALFFLCVVGLVIVILLSGTNLVLENQSGQNIKGIEVRYGRGIFQVDAISDKAIIDKSLGKIGEGATFEVQWHDGSGTERQAKFTIYFGRSWVNNSIRIRLLPDGKAVLFDGERQYEPDKP